MDLSDRKQKQLDSGHAKSSRKLKNISNVNAADVGEVDSEIAARILVPLVEKKRLVKPNTDQLPESKISKSKRRRLRKIRILGLQQPIVTPSLRKATRKADKQAQLKETNGTSIIDSGLNNFEQDNRPTTIIEKTVQDCHNSIANSEKQPVKEPVSNDTTRKKTHCKKHTNLDDQKAPLFNQSALVVVSQNLSTKPISSFQQSDSSALEEIGRQHLQSLTDVLNDLVQIYGPIYSHAEISNQVGNISKSNRLKPAETVSTSSNSRPLSSSYNIIPSESRTLQNVMEAPAKSREEVIAEREAKKKAKLIKVKPNSNATEATVKPMINLKKSVPSKELTSPPSTLPSTLVPLVKAIKKETVAPTILLPVSPAVVDTSINKIDKELTKSELKAVRRLKQELQRATKASQEASKIVKPDVPPKLKVAKLLQKPPTLTKTLPLVKISQPKHRVKLFNHLYNEKHSPENGIVMPLVGDVHPAIVCLGVQYAQRIVVGSNARCYALLNAMKKVIDDYRTPPQKEFARGLESCIQTSMAYLLQCRSPSVSMTNALRHLKWQLTQLAHNVSDREAKKKLNDAIDTYLRDQIDVAAQAICLAVQKKISNGDVILTYGCSSLVQRILVSAHEAGTQFRVVVVDARPWREGRHLLKRLVQCGIQCSYVLVAAASSIMREASKVLLGAHALLANGYVMSRAGSSQMALLAHSYNVPVLVCCETHKFCERVQTDSFVYNELGDPNDLVSTESYHATEPLANWSSISSLTPLNLTYDVTPPDLVTAVVTELAILPCTSVPVILRIKPTDAHM